MKPPSHDPEYCTSFAHARSVARGALNGLARYLTTSRSIASDAIMRLVGNQQLVVESPGHLEGLTAQAVDWAVTDRLRRAMALKRGGDATVLDIDACDANEGAFLADETSELLAYLGARDEFERRYRKRRPQAVLAVEAWFAHGRDIEAASLATGIDVNSIHAALVLFMNLFKRLEEDER